MIKFITGTLSALIVAGLIFTLAMITCWYVRGIMDEVKREK